ncbi:hypothetical protein [Methylomicrobium sp. Wu6]|uniref:hypothetical protein n=1 Tax=Methylomicrobium sp. Wu6 TaxID=3107928 RepID=UPI002DD691DE|nr:hypothetical protein [Methylomicrobium sp. Wu6]
MFKLTRLILLVLIPSLITGCSQAHVDIASAPAGKPKMEQQLDDLQCANLSRYTGPWMFHFLFYFSNKADYRKCLESKGYTVKD